MNDDRRFDQLIERSSLGTPVAKRLRRRAPKEVVEHIVAASEKSRSERGIRGGAPLIEERQAETTERRSAMPKKGDRHVVPNPKGGWDVKKPGSERASSHHDTQRAAEQRAKDISRNQGGGEVRIHDQKGRIRDSDTMPPARDPNPPKDEKH